MSILTLETKKYSIKIDNFEGPLDLLCYLIDKNKMNIYDVNLTEITNQYIEYLNAMEENLLEDIIEYLKQAKYIDDKEYIRKTVNNFLALKNLSIKELKYKLLSKGLNKNDIEDYIYENKEELEEYEIKSISNIIYKKSASMEQDEIKQYLLKKGYKTENINKAIEEN